MIKLRTMRRQPLAIVAGLCVAAGAVALAVEPAIWLVETWSNPVYDSPGGYICALVVGLAAWSLATRRGVRGGSATHAFWLFGATALIRLAGQVLAIHVLGALALAVDVYALALLAGLHERRRALSPFWLAVLFSLSLPVERIVQRLVGYGLQHLSAAGACSLLRVGYDEVACAGVDITLLGREVLVDLPCSGAQGLVLFGVLFAALAAVVRPTLRESSVGVGLAAVAALVANSLRIAALAVGLAHEPATGIDVMAQPWHDAVGLASLAVGFVPMLLWGRWAGGADEPSGEAEEETGPVGEREASSHSARRVVAAIVFLAAATAVLFAPSHPVDVAESADAIELPAALVGRPAQPRELRDFERDYFQRYGGGVSKAGYGEQTLLVVETSAPLRHLHAPDECLGGAGYEVDVLGETGGPLPAASYRAARPGGEAWRVDVTYVSEHGRVATSIAEAVWYWLGAPETSWRAIQRFHPVGTSPADIAAMEREIGRFYDIAGSSARPTISRRSKQ